MTFCRCATVVQMHDESFSNLWQYDTLHASYELTPARLAIACPLFLSSLHIAVLRCYRLSCCASFPMFVQEGKGESVRSAVPSAVNQG